MNKVQFLHELRAFLEGKVPAEELNDVLSYYEAYFEDSEEEEEQVAERLGSPASVAEQVLEGAGGCARRDSTPAPAAGRRRTALLWGIGAVAAAGILVLSAALLAVNRPGGSLTPSGSAVSAGAGLESPEPAETSPQISDQAGANQDISVTLDSFDALELEVDVASVQLKTGSEWKLRLVNRSQDPSEVPWWLRLIKRSRGASEEPYQLHYRNSDGVLSVWSTPASFSTQDTLDCRVEVTVPEGVALERADLNLGVGSVEWKGCAVTDLRVESGVGTLEMYAQAEKVQFSTGVGDVAMELAAPAETVELSTGVGDVTLAVAGDQSDYSWNLSTGIGDISLNGESAEPFTSDVEGGDGDRSLALDTGTGDVSLEFR